MKPLFTWAGGKNKMLKKYAPYLPKTFDRYIEPFLGAGAMFVWAYKQNPDAKFVLNDTNESIMQIYQAIKHDVNNFILYVEQLQDQYIPLAKVDRKKFYYEIRHEHAYDYESWHKTKEAATLYFLMKTGFNGIWQINKNCNNRYGTPAGLLTQKSVVFNKDNVKEWHKALQRCKLMVGDYNQTLRLANNDSFVFLDPPYRGSFTQYGVDFNDAIQVEVVSYLRKAVSQGSYVLFSNRDIGDNFFVDQLEENMTIANFDVTYTAGRRKKIDDNTFHAKKAKEILIIGNKN